MFNERELLDQNIEPEGELKSFIVNYVGDKVQPEDQRVTVEMIVEVLAQDFPELILVLAEENFVRGYSQGLSDFEQSLKQVKEVSEESLPDA
jgi:hypothetical protein